MLLCLGLLWCFEVLSCVWMGLCWDSGSNCCWEVGVRLGRVYLKAAGFRV